MSKSILDFIRKADSVAKQAAEAAKADDVFVNNYRAVVNEESAPETTNLDIGSNGETSNQITFRNARVGEKTGLQKISLLKSGGGEEDIFLIVPERESVGYGNIRGWGGPTDAATSDEPRNMAIARKAILDRNEEAKNTPNNAKEISEAATSALGVLGGAADIVAGNAISNNITKNKNSRYTGEDKAVGLGEQGQSEGQIFGMISSNGEIMSPSETSNFLKKLRNNGYLGISKIETPKKVQEHTGPAYVPGDILLGFLGLQPNRGSVGYTFKTPGENSKYRNFVNNLRDSNGR